MALKASACKQSWGSEAICVAPRSLAQPSEEGECRCPPHDGNAVSRMCGLDGVSGIMCVGACLLAWGGRGAGSPGLVWAFGALGESPRALRVRCELFSRAHLEFERHRRVSPVFLALLCRRPCLRFPRRLPFCGARCAVVGRSGVVSLSPGQGGTCILTCVPRS